MERSQHSITRNNSVRQCLSKYKNFSQIFKLFHFSGFLSILNLFHKMFNIIFKRHKYRRKNCLMFNRMFIISSNNLLVATNFAAFWFVVLEIHRNNIFFFYLFKGTNLRP